MPFHPGLTFWARSLFTFLILAGTALAVRIIEGGPTLPHDKLRRSHEAMTLVRTYRVAIDHEPPGEERRTVAEVEVKLPDDIAVHISGEGEIVDYIALGTSIYSRVRRFPLENPPWGEPQPRRFTMYPELSPYLFPSTAIESLLAAYDLREIGVETMDNLRLVHFQGKVNPAYAYQRGYALWLVRSKRAPPIKEGALGSSPPTLAWVLKYAVSVRYRIDTQQEGLELFVKHPAQVDIWTHPRNLVPHIVQITYPEGAETIGAPAGTIHFRFRDFNQNFEVSPYPLVPRLPEVKLP